MKLSQLATRSALGALAAALTVTALPAAARDEDDTPGNRGRPRAEQMQAAPQQSGRQAAFERMQQRSEARAQGGSGWQGRPQAQQVETQQVQRAEAGRQWQGRQQQDAQRQQWQSRQQAQQVQQAQTRQQWQDGQRREWQGRQQDAQRQAWQDRQQAAQRQQWQDRDRAQQTQTRDWQAQQARNRTYADQTRSTTYRTRDGSRYQTNPSSYRDYNRTNQRWDRNWRSDNRYDWQRYRTTNRYAFNLGTYYSPYRNYSYRRLSIGFNLLPLFYSNNYWIDDPWQYRLPEVYGPYRWVRYYDDALLVDIYSGEVVDVIYDFFW